MDISKMSEVIPSTLELGEEFYYEGRKHMKVGLLLGQENYAVDLTTYRVRIVNSNEPFVYIDKPLKHHWVRVRDEDGEQIAWVADGKTQHSF